MKNNTRPIGYQLSQQHFNTILSKRNETQKKENPYKFVMDFINEQYDLRGTVTHISIFDE